MNGRKITKMYIELYRAINDNLEESNDLIQYIVNVIRDNLNFYEIDKYTGDGSPTDEIEYYIDEMSKKYLNIDNIFNTRYWKVGQYIPPDAKEMLEVAKIINTIKTEKEVKHFLDWYKEIQSGIVCYFDYEIITKNQISDIIKESECEDICIEVEDYNWYTGYNPIICWEVEHDEPTLFIMDWRSLSHNIAYNGWLVDIEDIESLIKTFSAPTLEEYLYKEYNHLNREIRIALEYEVNSFYNMYKDDLDNVIDKEKLIDTIYDDSLFSTNIIKDLVMKLYRKEIRL